MDEATRLFHSYSQQALTLTVECVPAVALGNELVGSSPTIGIFPYVAQAVETRASYHQDNASVQRAPLRSTKCADTAGHPGYPLYQCFSTFVRPRPGKFFL